MTGGWIPVAVHQCVEQETAVVWQRAAVGHAVASSWVRQAFVLDELPVGPPDISGLSACRSPGMTPVLLGWTEGTYTVERHYLRRALWLELDDYPQAPPEEAVVAATVRAGRAPLAPAINDQRGVAMFDGWHFGTRFGTLPDGTVVAHLTVEGEW